MSKSFRVEMSGHGVQIGTITQVGVTEHLTSRLKQLAVMLKRTGTVWDWMRCHSHHSALHRPLTHLENVWSFLKRPLG